MSRVRNLKDYLFLNFPGGKEMMTESIDIFVKLLSVAHCDFSVKAEVSVSERCAVWPLFCCSFKKSVRLHLILTVCYLLAA